MSHKTGDLRSARTRKAIVEAFIALVRERGFDQVTAGEIARRAMVNRATFYRHYRDKYHLVEDIFEQMTRGLVAELGPPGPLHPADRVATWAKLFAHIGRQADIYGPLLGPHGSPWFAARLREHCVELARQRLTAVSGTSHPDVQQIPLVMVASQLVGGISWWLEHRQPVRAEQMADAFVRITSYGYFQALGLGDLLLEAPCPPRSVSTAPSDSSPTPGRRSAETPRTDVTP